MNNIPISGDSSIFGLSLAAIVLLLVNVAKIWGLSPTGAPQAATVAGVIAATLYKLAQAGPTPIGIKAWVLWGGEVVIAGFLIALTAMGIYSLQEHTTKVTTDRKARKVAAAAALAGTAPDVPVSVPQSVTTPLGEPTVATTASGPYQVSYTPNGTTVVSPTIEGMTAEQWRTKMNEQAPKIAGGVGTIAASNALVKAQKGAMPVQVENGNVLTYIV